MRLGNDQNLIETVSKTRYERGLSLSFMLLMTLGLSKDIQYHA